MEFRWGTSRAADTYGYTTCACRVDGKRLGFCSGGGYDLKGTAFGQALCKLYPDRLKALAEAGKAHGEYDLKEDGAYVGRKIENQRDRLYGMSATPALGFRIGGRKEPPTDPSAELSTVDTPTVRKPSRKAQETGMNAAQGVADSILALVSHAGANAEALETLRADLFSLGARVESIENNPPAAQSVTLRFQIGNLPAGPEIANARPELSEMLRTVAAGLQNLYLCGPAGSGKTTLARDAAKALGRAFGFQSFAADSTAATLIGAPNAQGIYQETEYVRIYEEGGVYLLDEIDAAPAEILTVVNASLANGVLALPRHHNPDRRVIHRHADTVVIAAANTWGSGATAEYVGRSPIDAATLDRFAGARFHIDYDATLEESFLGSQMLGKIRDAREKLAYHKIRRILSTRSVIAAARMISAGFNQDEVCARLVTGWSESDRSKAGL